MFPSSVEIPSSWLTGSSSNCLATIPYILIQICNPPVKMPLHPQSLPFPTPVSWLSPINLSGFICNKMQQELTKHFVGKAYSGKKTNQTQIRFQSQLLHCGILTQMGALSQMPWSPESQFSSSVKWRRQYTPHSVVRFNETTYIQRIEHKRNSQGNRNYYYFERGFTHPF